MEVLVEQPLASPGCFFFPQRLTSKIMFSRLRHGFFLSLFQVILGAQMQILYSAGQNRASHNLQQEYEFVHIFCSEQSYIKMFSPPVLCQPLSRSIRAATPSPTSEDDLSTPCPTRRGLGHCRQITNHMVQGSRPRKKISFCRIFCIQAVGCHVRIQTQRETFLPSSFLDMFRKEGVCQMQ